MSIIEKALRKENKQVISTQTIPNRISRLPFRAPSIIAITMLGIISTALLITLVIIIRRGKDYKPLVRISPAAPAIFKPATRSLQPVLSGIIFGEGEPFAVINNSIMRKGDSMNGITLLNIYMDKVKVSYKEKELILSLSQ